MNMNRTRVCTVFLMRLALLAGLLVAGCKKDTPKAGSGDAKWLGAYKNSKEGSTLVLQPEHKGTLDAAGQKGDITWEIAGDDKIIVHAGIPIEMFRNADGNLRDQESTEWKKS
jgi:hypothetical protein